MSKINGTPTEREARDKHRNTREVRPDTPLRPDLQKLLDGKEFDKFPRLTKDGVYEFLNDEQKIPVKRNAIVVAFNNREMTTGLFSGQRLTSQYDAMRWALAKLSVESQIQVAS